MKSKFDQMLEFAGWPAILVTENGEIQYANAAAGELFGPPIKTGAPGLDSIWSPDNPESPAQFIARLDRAKTSVKPLRCRIKSGSSTLFKSYICPLTRERHPCFIFQLFSEPAANSAATAPPAMSLGAPAPATDSPPAQPAPPPAPVDMPSAQKQKLDCALQLIRSVVLDFNNSLTSILGHTSLILSKMEEKHPLRKSLIEIEKSAEKAAETVNDLSAFSRQDKEHRATTNDNVNELLRRTMDLVQAPSELQLEWRLQLEPKPYAAIFDEAKMQQAFLKIFENSVQSARSPALITVATRNLIVTEPLHDGASTVTPGNYLCIDISDNGIGIAPEILPRIFEPFFTTKQNHRGLGLAWVYGVVTNHRGSVTVSSQPGQDTTVRIYLPANKEFARDRNLKDADLGGHETILVVDDETLVLNLCELVLSSYGYRVITATSGEKAIEIIGQTQNRIEVVISDLVMPGMSGREFLEKARRLLPQARFMRCSGYVHSPSQEENETFLRKPYTSHELLQAVRRVCA
jgi:two-component system, cell cycle sensor histidine kinase and response regulator CckA